MEDHNEKERERLEVGERYLRPQEKEKRRSMIEIGVHRKRLEVRERDWRS